MAVSTVAFAQKNKVQIPEMPMDSETELISYSEVVSVGGASAADLYDRAFNWGKGITRILVRSYVSRTRKEAD